MKGYGTISDEFGGDQDDAKNDAKIRRRWIMGCVVLFVVVLGGSLVAGVVANNSGQGGCAADVCTLTTDMQGLLSAHNADRALHAAAPLVWDQGLANDASAWVVQCKYQHQGTAGEGENLFMSSGYSMSATIADATPTWYGEVSQYDFSNPGFSDATGHFTQVVWKATTNVGCAATTCNPIQGGTGSSIFVSCRYTPPGNVDTQYQTNVT